MLSSYLLNDHNFSKILSALTIFPKSPKLAVAVSGGSDSITLAIYCARWVTKFGGEVTALIVDHQMREESTLEAKFVKELLKDYNIRSVILTREKLNLTSAIQSKAREDRYRLLEQYCQKYHIPYLLLAHHLDDQIETLIMREEKGVNIIGNSGMAAKLIKEQVIILRPFLQLSKAHIRDKLQKLGGKWVEDPSNQNDKYKRVQIRESLKKLSLVEKLNLLKNLTKNVKNRQNIESQIMDFLIKGVIINKFGLLKLNLILFNTYERVVKIIILRKLLKYASGSFYYVKIKKIENLLTQLKTIQFNTYSLGNCILKIKKDFLIIFKEAKNLNLNLPHTENFCIWDGRFFIQGLNPNQWVGVLNPEILEHLKKDKDFIGFFLKHNLKEKEIKSLPWIYETTSGQQDSWKQGTYHQFYYKAQDSLLMSIFCD
ncbi:tRNA lysidine(34) synthetase TilS [Candidatus Hepatincolaceae symbiont of Richtersius coronifer]